MSKFLLTISLLQVASARKEVTAKREVKVELKKGDKRWDFLEMYSFK